MTNPGARSQLTEGGARDPDMSLAWGLYGTTWVSFLTDLNLLTVTLSLGCILAAAQAIYLTYIEVYLWEQAGQALEHDALVEYQRKGGCASPMNPPGAPPLESRQVIINSTETSSKLIETSSRLIEHQGILISSDLNKRSDRLGVFNDRRGEMEND